MERQEKYNAYAKTEDAASYYQANGGNCPAPYQKAPQVKEVAQEVINSYHPHLNEASIAYLYRTSSWKSKGRIVTGKAATAPPLWRYLSGIDLVLVINQLTWRNLTAKARRALVDHKLSHFTEPEVDKAGLLRWQTQEYDLMEFSQVVKRHGICIGDPKALKDAAGQNLEALQQSIDFEEKKAAARDRGRQEFSEEDAASFDDLLHCHDGEEEDEDQCVFTGDESQEPPADADVLLKFD